MTVDPGTIWTLTQITVVGVGGLSLILTMRSNQATLRETVRDIKAVLKDHGALLQVLGERVAAIEATCRTIQGQRP